MTPNAASTPNPEPRTLNLAPGPRPGARHLTPDTLSHPRLMYYSDGHHFHAKRLDPPLNMHKMRWPVDELVGTGVQTLVFGLGFGDVYFHQTKVGRIIGQDQESWKSFIDWRIMRMVKDAHAMGTDQVREVIKRGREMGIHVFPSLKMQDPAEQGAERCGRLKWEHGKDVTLGEPQERYPAHGTEWCYDYTNGLVRQDKLAMVREMLEDYEAEGMELDFMFFPLYFRKQDTEKGVFILNDLVAEIREAADEIGEKQGRRIPIIARVWSQRDDNLRIGIDVEAWMKAGSIDMVVGQMTGLMLDTGLPGCRWLADAANDAGVPAYVRPDRRIEDPRSGMASIEMYRAFSQTARWMGFAGIQHHHLPWPFAEAEYQALRELGYPDAVYRRDKRYFLAPNEKFAPYVDPAPRQVPHDFVEGKKATFTLTMADDVESARADGEMRQPILTLAFRFFCVEDDVKMTFNGKSLPLAQADSHEPRRGQYWFTYHLDPERVVQGDNTLTIEIKRMEPTAGFTRTLSGMELHMRYKDFERPESLDPVRIGPPS